MIIDPSKINSSKFYNTPGKLGIPIDENYEEVELNYEKYLLLQNINYYR